MTERQQKLLKTIIESYSHSAQPVASGFLANEFAGSVSSATIRNDMVVLEKEGYIKQPHTSSGRVPTEKAYLEYVNHYVKKSSLALKEKSALQQGLESVEDSRQALKSLAKEIAEYSQEAVLIAFEKNDSYYTGLSNLFAKPEFTQQQRVIDISSVIDHLDQVLYTLFDEIEDTVVKIAAECPFDHACSTVITRFTYKGQTGLMAIVGPMRMKYQHNLDLMNFVKGL